MSSPAARVANRVTGRLRTFRRQVGGSSTPVGVNRGKGRLRLSGRATQRLQWLPPRVFRIVAQRARTVDVAGLEVAGSKGVAQLAAAGACLVGDAPANDGSSLAELVRDADVATPLDRARHSVRLRRAARRWSEVPSISVVMATKRPWALPAAMEQMSGQVDVDVEISLGLHGAAWDDWSDERIRDLTPWPVRVTRVPEAASLGTVLNEATSNATSSIVTKWDDDDWYGRGHLADVVDALDYAGATLVGKAAEFVYLESSDVLIRRDADRSERFSTRLAGGTFTISRDDLRRVGGWPDVRRHVDLALLESIRRAGGTTYRTHGFDYILMRRPSEGADHTWAADDAYFLSIASDRWTGLRTDLASA